MALSRTWATPLTVGAFLLSAVTGVLMFFHLDTGLNKAAHEWLGWAMVLAVVLHAIVNGSAFMRHLQTPSGRWIVGAFAVVLALSFLPLGNEGKGNPARKATTAVLAAPVSALGGITGLETTEVVQRLHTVGLEVDDPQRSITDLTAGDRDRAMAALGVLFP